MIKNLFDVEEEERVQIELMSTHFNIHYHRSMKYKSVFNVLSSLVDKSDKEVWCIVTNIARSINIKAKGIKIPRGFNAYKENNQKISHKKMVALLDSLERNGYLDFYRGGLLNKIDREDADVRLTSVYVITDKMLSMWRDIDVSKEKNPYSFVQVRDRLTKEQMSLNRRTGVSKMKEFLEKYNSLLAKTEIVVDGSILPVQQYARIFSDGTDKGGRYYNLCGGIQTMPKELRGSILINGEPTVELDYKSLHPSLLYERIEWEMHRDVGCKRDPYDIDLTGLFYATPEVCGSKKGLRELIKQTMLIALSAKNIAAARSSITNNWYEEYKKGKEGRFYGVGFISSSGRFPVNELCQRVKEAHPLIADAFFSDIGIVLQKVDSEIMTIILESFTAIDVCALSWHDSIVVPQKYKDFANAQMLAAYKAVVGRDNHCRIDLKGKQ